MAEVSAIDAVQQFIMTSSETTFKVKDLEEVYILKLSDFGIQQSSHITRFVEKLKTKDFGVTPIQKEDNTVHYALKKETFEEVATSSSDWLKMLRRVVKPIRQEIIDCKKSRDLTALEVTDLSEGSSKLKVLLTMLCEDNPRIINLPLSLSSLTQLISMNTKRKSKSRDASLPPVVSRNKKEDHEKVPQYLTLKLYSIIRSKSLLKAFFHHGILLSPYTVTKFFDELTPSVIKLFKDSGGKVLPSNIRTGIFSVVVDDNLDENSKSPTSKHNFHGSSISILQFPTTENKGTCRERIPYQQLSDMDKRIDTSVVDNFTNVRPVSINLKNSYYPIQTVCLPEDFEPKLLHCYKENFLAELKWSSKVANAAVADHQLLESQEAQENQSKLSWTAHHAGCQRSPQNEITISAILPLIDYTSNTIEFQYHIMCIGKEYTAYINPSQTTVGCSDQPLYAIKKKIQWACPQKFPLTQYFPFIGGLHVEQALLRIHGQLATGTGIDDIFGIAKLPTVGLKNALCNVSDIKKARYTVQMISCCLTKHLNDSFNSANVSNVSMHDWAEAQTSSMFKYFYGVLKFELNILMVVRSFREGNIYLLLASLKKALELCFALDHYNYARWLSVFVQDLEMASVNHPDDNNVFKDISNHLSVRSTNSQFNGVAYDQKHENNNKHIKSTGGYIDLVNREDKAHMRKLEICLPEVLQYLENCEGKKSKTKHKEQSDLFSSRFLKDCKTILDHMTTNPFSEDNFKKINSPVYFPEAIIQDCDKVFQIGYSQYRNFVMTRFILGTEDVITSSIRKNNLKLPSALASLQKRDSVQIKFSQINLTKIRDALLIRVSIGKNLFKDEFTRVPESMFKDGEAYHNNKSDLLQLITPIAAMVKSDGIDANGLVVDLSTVIRSYLPFAQSCPELTYGMFAKQVLSRIENLAISSNVNRRVDIVQDKYFLKSIKNAMRSTRGSGRGIRVCFEENDLIIDDLEAFIANSENKSDLNSLIAEYAARATTWNWGGEVCVTYGRGVRSTQDGSLDMMQFIDEVHEEADNRIVVHINNMLESGIDKILVRTGDTDVIIIILGFMSHFLFKVGSAKIWVDFGTGKSRKIFDINQIYDHIGEPISLGLPFFHSFSGCDSTASFFGKSKKFWFDHWMAQINDIDDITSVFTQLSWLPSEETVGINTEALVKFVATAYNPKKKCSASTLEEIRYNIFTTSANMDLRLLPPSKEALKLHICRCSYQAGWIWGNTISQNSPPDVEHWGWTLSHPDNRLKVLWQPPEHDSSASRVLSELLTICKCSREAPKCLSCNCGKKGFACINLCSCNKKCSDK